MHVHIRIIIVEIIVRLCAWQVLFNEFSCALKLAQAHSLQMHMCVYTVFVLPSCVCVCVCVCVVAFPEEDEESGSEDEDGPKLRSSIPGSNPVPLGWPKVRNVL